MKTISSSLIPGAAALAVLFAASASFGQYNQAAVGVYAPSTNAVDKSATVSPNDVTSFSSAVAAAFAAGTGGVFDLPTAAAGGTTNYRATYGLDNTKRLSVYSSVSMQSVGWPPSGSFHPVSYQYATTSSADQSAYNLGIGPITDAATGADWLSEEVSQVGLTILSRTHTTQYPADIRVTASFSDGTTQAATANVGNVKGADDTFFGFTAPPDEAVTNLLIECFVPGTTTPRATRVAWDDLGFITAPTGILPPPQIAEIYPAAGAVHWASNGVRFEARSAAPIDPAGIGLVLNSVDVSSQLVVTGEPTNRFVSFNGLAADLQYTMEITVANSAGVASVTNTFYTPETPLAIFDSEGFSSEVLYPVGLLQAVTNAGSHWAPAVEAAEIVDLFDGQHGKILRRMQMGSDQIDYLIFPSVSSGTVIIELDARVSSLEGRTMDLSLNRATANGGGTQGPFLMWGTNALNYYNRTAWVPQTTLDLDWHHVALTCYVSGPLAGTFDLAVDSVPAGEGLLWRTVFTPVGTLRIGAIRGDLVQYGDVDNLVIKVAPEPIVALPVTLLRPAHDGSTFSFSFQSLFGVFHLVQYNSDLTTANWTTLETIPGDGTEKTVTHSSAPAGQLFYRVESRLP